MEERSERDRGAEVRPGRERGVALLGGLIALGGALAAGAWLWSAGSPEERRFRPPTEAPEPERVVALLEAPDEAAQAGELGTAPAGDAPGVGHRAPPPGAPEVPLTPLQQAALEDALAEGAILDVLEGRAGSWNGPTSPFGREQALGQDPMEALGGLMGGATGGAQAPGALGLRGTGRGGGGAGSGYGGLGVHGAIGGGAGAPAALGRSGVLASNFVAGSGVRTRLRDLLDRGVEIDGEHVRLEAFQERAALSYPVPARDAVALYAEAERARVRAAGDVVHLQIALVGRRGERPARPPLDVRLVLDRSGSMEGEKWAHAVDAAERLVERLRPRDRFALVTYDDEARLDVPPRRVGDGRAIVRTLRGLAPGGGTNIGAALELVRAHPPERRAGGVGMVMLLSDGEATTGVTDARSLGGLARRVFDETGALVTTVGVGTRFDEATMLAMAREGSGSYHFVARPSDVPRILADELEERAQAVAQALRVRVELAPGVVARKVYGSRLLAEGEAATVRRTERRLDARLEAELGIVADREEEEEGLRMHLPTFRRGDQHVILVELEVPPGRAGTTAGLARVHLDYKDLVRRRNGDAEVRVGAARVADDTEAVASVDRTVKRTVLAFQAGEALQRAAGALEGGDRAAALATLRERRELLEVAAERWRDPRLARDARLLARYERVVDRAWAGFGPDGQRELLLAMGWFGDRRMR